MGQSIYNCKAKLNITVHLDKHLSFDVIADGYEDAKTTAGNRVKDHIAFKNYMAVKSVSLEIDTADGLLESDISHILSHI